MACLEHECDNKNCTYHDINNTALKVCPWCGATLTTTFDEYPETFENDYEKY